VLSASTSSWPVLLVDGSSIRGRYARTYPFVVLAAAFAVHGVWLRQPLLENYIDRQVHTAMMARNLSRGGSLLYPSIDIGPFPAYYMLEFPLYPWLAGKVAAVTGLPLDSAGRLLSAFAMGAACAFLFDLVRRRDGGRVAWAAAAVLAVMPVTMRYGRAFQPDSLMIAALVAAVWSMDRWSKHGRPLDLTLAAAATCATLLLKVIAAYLLIPLLYLAWSRCGLRFWRRWELWLAAAAAAAPAVAWYLHAWHVAASSETVSTPFWQVHKWIALDRLMDANTHRQLVFYVGLRVLTPIGVSLAIVGALLRAAPNDSSSAPRDGSMLFHVWLGSLLAYGPILVRKLDHEHYYLAIAPVAAVFMARSLAALWESPLARRFYVSGSWAAAILGLLLLASDCLACRSTFRDPAEWRHVTTTAAAVRDCTPPGALVAAHSSVLFYADRRGFTVAYNRDEIEYLLGTWGERDIAPIPENLLEFYRRRGAEYFVELLGTNRELDNAAFFETVRGRYRIVREVPGKFLIVSLHEPQELADSSRQQPRNGF
jgi:hypothetical protein